MEKDFVIETIADAFVALNQIPDEEAWGMLKVKDANKQKRMNESKSFSVLNFNDQELDEAEKFLHDNKEETELEVIDADADTVEHVKDNEEYIGQAILCCNRCKAKRFLDLDKLVQSEDDPDTYNVDDECPYCKTDGAGFELVGQVGKVDKEEEPAPALDNDELANEEGVTFDNDYKEEEPKAEEPAEEKPAEEPKKKFKLSLKKKSSDDVAADDSDLLDLPDLGEAFDPDQNLKESTDGVYNALNLNEEVSNNAEQAWLMNKVIASMNDEEAYYSSWLYIWPDGETRDECEYDFSEDEDFADLKDAFIDTYKEYHEGGLYDADEETEAYAHKWDEILELEPIENIKKVTRESLEEAKKDEPEDEEEEEKAPFLISDFFSLMMDPEEMEDIVINGFEGSYEDIPSELLELPLVSFNVADGHLVIDITKDEDPERITLGEFLPFFEDEEMEKINLVDAQETEDLFNGNKADAIEQFGDWQISFVSKPEILVMVAGDQPEVDEEPVEESLFEKICKANNLFAYKANRYNTEEYWLRENLKSRTDLEEVYNTYCVNNELRNEFKARFDFRDINDDINTIKENLITSKNCAVVYGYRNNNKPCIVSEARYVNTKAELDAAVESICHKYMINADQVLVEYYPTKEAYIIKSGKGFYNENTNDFVTDEEHATIFINEDLAQNAAQDAMTITSNAKVVKADNDFVLVESMSNAKPLPVINEEVKVEEEKEPITEKAWTIDQFNKVRELAAKLGIGENMVAIEDYAKERGLKNMTEILDCMEAEVESLNAKEEASAHVVATGESGQTYVSVDGGKTWEQCSQEEYDELVNGGYKVGHITEELNEEEKLTEEINGVELPLESANTLRKFARAAIDTCKAIKRHYNIDVNIAKIIADMFSDLGLLDPSFDLTALDGEPFASMTAETFENADNALEAVDSVLWELVGSSYEELSPEEIEQISNLLDAPEFSAENLDASVASDAFIEAAEAGEIPYIDPETNLREALIKNSPVNVNVDLHNFGGSGNVVDVLSGDLGEEVEDEALIKDSPLNINIDAHEFGGQNNDVDVMNTELGEEVDESVEVDTELFDKEINEYFAENYEDTVFYHTNSGSINDKGQIVLEGYVVNEKVDQPITWTLTPMQPLSEALQTQEDVAKALGCTEFKAENNLSEEVFKFSFVNDTPNKEIFEFKEEEKINILDKFIKECGAECQKFMNPKEVVKAAAEMYYNENKAECDKLGIDVCNIESQLATVVDQIDLQPAIENAEPEK